MVNAIGSLFLQTFFWILLAKKASGSFANGMVLFGCYLIGLGWGNSSGMSLGNWLANPASPVTPLSALPLIIAGLTVLVMAGWTQTRQSNCKAPTVEESLCFTAGSNHGVPTSDLSSLIKQHAHSFSRTYGLSQREEEIVAFLLSGRSRPYIRDTLGISLNTVNTHVRNIYAKADIHSLQELLDRAGGD